MTSGPGSQRLDRRGLQTRAVSGALWTLVHTMVSIPLAFVVNIIVARILGVADFGRLAYLTMVMELAVVVVTVGVGSGLIQFGAKAHSIGDYGTVRSLLRRSQGFRLLVGAPILSLIVLGLANVPPVLLALAILFGIWVPAGFGGATAALTIQNDTARAARLALVMSLIMQVAVVAAVLLLPTPDVVWGTRLVITGLGVIAAIALVDRRYRRAVLRPRAPWGMPSGFWRYSIPMGISGIVSAIALSRSEVVLLQQLSTAQQMGLYAVAFGLAGHLFAPAQALLTPLTPAVSALREVEVAAIRGAFRRTARVSGVLGGFVIALGGPVLALLVPVLYGSAFRQAQDLVLALTIVSGFLLLTFPMQAFVTARLRSMSVLSVNMLSALSAVALALITIPALGAWGAVLAKVVVVLVRVGWLAWRETESFMVGRLEFFGVFRATGVAAVTALTVHIAVKFVEVDGLEASLMWTPGVLLSSCAGYILLLKIVRGGLSTGDIHAIQRVLPPRIRPIVESVLKLVLRPPEAADRDDTHMKERRQKE